MNIEIRNKYCGLLMFNTKNSSEFVTDSSFSSFEQPESYYKSQNDSQETSIAAGAADVTKDNNDNNNNNNKSNNNKTSAAKSKTEKSPPRPPNAFILYRREKQPAILATHRHLSNAEISRYIASLWRNETNEVRLKWERFADQTKLEHMKAYPNYVYRPNKNKEKSEKKRNKQTTSTSTVPTVVSNTSANTSAVPSIIVNSPSSDMFATNQIGPIRVSTKGQHRVNMIDRPHQLHTTSYTSMLSSPTDITSFYDPLMSFGYTDIPSNTSTASSISSISSVASSEHQQQMNQINHINQMNQMNQINQMNQMNQMNHFQDPLDDFWRIIPTQPEEISQQQQQLSGTDFSFHPINELSSPTTTPPSASTIPTTIPVSIPSVDSSIVYCNNSNNDSSFYNHHNQQTTLPSEFDNYFGIFNC